jgi:predicted transposase/invertase (TIGR01784 family)
MYDNFSKFLTDEYPHDFSSWLLGEPIAFTELLPKELSIEPIRADSMILLQSLKIILHLEFQTDPDSDMPFRMADYALRIYRKFPDRQLVQVVIYLRKTTSRKVYETRFAANNFVHEFRVVRLWEEETEPFLQSTGLLPYAALTKTDDREGVLREVARKIDAIDSRREQGNLTAISAVMGALSLDNDVIQRILRRDIMQASPMYQEMQSWAREDARAWALKEVRKEVQAEVRKEVQAEVRKEVQAEVRKEVQAEVRKEVQAEVRGEIEGERRSIALNMLRKNLPLETIAEVTGLTIAQLQQLQDDRIN